MGAHADVADFSACLQLFHIPDVRPVHKRIPVGFLVHKVNHPQINVICLKPCQQVLKRFPALIHVAAADILAVLPGGTDVSLDKPALPPARKRFSDIGAHIRLGHPAVQNINTQPFGAVDNGFAFLVIMALQPLRPKSNLTDHQICFTKTSIMHNIPPVFFI